MAAVAGYSSIGGAGGKPDPNAPTTTTTSTGNIGNGADILAPNGVGERLSSISRAAGVVAAGAKEAVTTFAVAPMPLVKLYTQPLDPTESLTPRARLELVWNSCRDWREFFDLRAMNLPPASEVKLRMGQNVETFFYNYFSVSLLWLALQAIIHPLRGSQIAAIAALAALFYAIHPDPIAVPFGNARSIILTDTAKHAIIIASSIASLLFGGVASIIFSVVSFAAFVSLVHSFLRDHREPDVIADV